MTYDEARRFVLQFVGQKGGGVPSKAARSSFVRLLDYLERNEWGPPDRVLRKGRGLEVEHWSGNYLYRHSVGVDGAVVLVTHDKGEPVGVRVLEL